VGECVPDITFILDVDAETARARMQGPRRADRMEQQPAEFYERVRAAYRELAAREPKRIVLINGSESPDKIDHAIWQILAADFPDLVKAK
jgi:dTMP kinase